MLIRVILFGWFLIFFRLFNIKTILTRMYYLYKIYIILKIQLLCLIYNFTMLVLKIVKIKRVKMFAVKTHIRHYILLGKKQENQSDGLNLLMISMLLAITLVDTGLVMLTLEIFILTTRNTDFMWVKNVVINHELIKPKRTVAIDFY